ncbi:MAG TPA: hypothetical protein VGQ36_00645 [Thermoanaerobaculia bacterium]|jgi:hypothetical protein|nr:hypothetical protein [Thermoanaerobaculia bacterium]
MKKTLLLLLSLAPAAFAADVTGRFDAGTRYREPEAHAPAQVSRMFARTVPKSGSIELPATGAGGMLIWTIGPETVRTRLRTPNGAMLSPTDRGSIERGLRRFEEGADEVLHVMRTTPATYSLDVEGSATIVAAEPDSMLTLSTWAAPLSRQPGEPVTLHAELRDGDEPLTGAKVTARLASPNGRTFDSLELHDRGDGVYEVTIADLPARIAGAWQVRFDAEGANANGVRFARTGAGELVAERGAARLGGIRTEVVGDVLRISVDADVALRGAYRFDVIVADHNGNGLAWAEGARQLNIGATSLEIEIPLADLAGVAAEDLFLDARLLGLDTMGVAGRVTR